MQYAEVACVDPNALTLPMLEATFIQSTKTQIVFQKPSKACHAGIRWIALTEHSQMSTYVPGFQSFLRFLYHFVLAKLATSI